jgi:hypothetical protein
MLKVWHGCGTLSSVETTDHAKAAIRAKILSILEAPSLPGMLDIVHTIDDFVVTSASAAGIKSEQFSVVRSMAVQNAFPILFVAKSYGVDEYFQYLDSAIKQYQSSQLPTLGVFFGPPERPAFGDQPLEIDPLKLRECGQLYRLALLSFESEGTVANEGQQILRKLMATLKISFDDLGKMFKVSGETVRRWENGTNSIPMDKSATILSTQGPLDKLLQIFQPARLPVVIRRTSDLFDGERALDWILRGRIADVATRYEVELSYQA